MPAFLIWAASLREGRGPGHHQAAHHLVLQLDLLGYGKRVVYLDAEIGHRAALVRRIECVPSAELSSSALATREWTIRAYCRVDRCGGVRTRLGKRYQMFRFRVSASHAWIAVRVCSAISNCTGRPVFF